MEKITSEGKKFYYNSFLWCCPETQYWKQKETPKEISLFFLPCQLGAISGRKDDNTEEKFIERKISEFSLKIE